MSVTSLQLKRGSAAQNDAYTGLNGEITIDTDAKTLRIHDGVTAGGSPISLGIPSYDRNLIETRGTYFFTSTQAIAAGTAFFLPVNWRTALAGTSGAVEVGRSDVSVPETLGSVDPTGIRVKTTTAVPTLPATTRLMLTYGIPPHVSSVLQAGTGQGGHATLSFLTMTNKPGVYCAQFSNIARDMSYVAEFTISAADTWEKKTITIPIPTSGDFSDGFRVGFTLASGMEIGTKDTWTTTIITATSSQTNLLAAVNNYIEFRDVQFEKGTIATPSQSYGHGGLENALYFSEPLRQYFTGYSPAGSAYGHAVQYMAPKRAAPTIARNYLISAWGYSTSAFVTSIYDYKTMLYGCVGYFGIEQELLLSAELA